MRAALFPWLAFSQADRFAFASTVIAPLFFGAAVALVKLTADAVTAGFIHGLRRHRSSD